MGLLDNIKQQIGSQFIEILQWLDDTNDSMVYRFPVYNQEIKMNAQLTVRENQAALFINEGKAADLFAPGRYQLSTQNLPILTTLRGWKYGFQSPFKAEVYFFNTRLFTDLKWGTTNPVMMRDAEFGMIRLRAFGTYAMKIADPKAFFATVVGTRGLSTTEEITGQLRSTILSRLSDAIAESKIAALDLASKYDELSTHAKRSSAPSSGASASSSRGSSSRTSRCRRRSRPPSTSGRSWGSSATGSGSSRSSRPPRRSRRPPRTRVASPARAPASARASRSAGRWGARSSRSEAPPRRPARDGAPPPPPGAAAAAAPRWSLTVDGKTYGPYTDDALKAMVAAGQVAPATLAWHPGAAGWAPLSTLRRIRGRRPPAPPPPPPPPARPPLER